MGVRRCGSGCLEVGGWVGGPCWSGVGGAGVSPARPRCSPATRKDPPPHTHTSWPGPWQPPSSRWWRPWCCKEGGGGGVGGWVGGTCGGERWAAAAPAARAPCAPPPTRHTHPCKTPSRVPAAPCGAHPRLPPLGRAVSHLHGGTRGVGGSASVGVRAGADALLGGPMHPPPPTTTHTHSPPGREAAALA